MRSTSSYATKNFAIISADYVGSNQKRHRLDLIEELNQNLDKHRKKDEQYFEPENVLILWKKNPDEKYLRKKLGHSNHLLIYEFCNRIAYTSKSEPVELFIDKPQTLFEEDESMFTVLESLISIWKQTKIIPILLKDDFLALDKKWLLGQENWKEDMYNSDTLLESMKISYLAKETTMKEKASYFETVKGYYEHFYSSIEKLIKILEPLENKPKKNIYLDDEPRTDFIHTYFLWQSGIYTSVEKAQEAMEQDIPVSSWYRYCDKFENNIVYEEYTVAYWRYLFVGNDKEMQEQNQSFKRDGYLFRPKKGRTPDAIKYLCFINTEERRTLFETGYEPMNPYLEFDEIKSLIDVKRVEYTANIQFRHLRTRRSGGNAASDEHYGFKVIEEKVTKAGYELGDLYPITSKRSPYYDETQERLGLNDLDEWDFYFPDREEEDIEKEWSKFLDEQKKAKKQD